MEILATNTSYAAAIFLTVVTLAIISALIAVILDKDKGVGERRIAGAVTIIAAVFLVAVWLDPTYVTYDAIVTDWNAVYEQGYEVVETNGKIVTLRKVDE